MSDMTQSFIEMVEAFKAKPELEAQIKRLTDDNAMCYGTIEQLRFEIVTLEATKANLEAKLSEVTKERDDASFRNLELDEKLAGIEKLLGLAERLEQARRDEHKATVDAMTPKPEPVPFHQEPIPDWMKSEPVDIVAGSGQSAADPTLGMAALTTTDAGGPTSADPIYPSLSPSEPDGWERGKPYSYKPWYMTDSEWVSRGGFGPDLAPPMADPSPF